MDGCHFHILRPFPCAMATINFDPVTPNQPLLEYLFTQSGEPCRVIIHGLVHQVLAQVCADDYNSMHALVQRYETEGASSDVYQLYLLLLIILPEMDTFIEQCKVSDREDRVDAFLSHVRRLRLNWLRLDHNPELGIVYHGADFVYQCILYYHCL
jgi:hypothetical protein